MTATPEQLARNRQLVLDLVDHQGPLSWSEIHLGLGGEVSEGYGRRALAELVRDGRIARTSTTRHYPTRGTTYTYAVDVFVYSIIRKAP